MARICRKSDFGCWPFEGIERIHKPPRQGKYLATGGRQFDIVTLDNNELPRPKSPRHAADQVHHRSRRPRSEFNASLFVVAPYR